jgi:TonB family protein
MRRGLDYLLDRQIAEETASSPPAGPKDMFETTAEYEKRRQTAERFLEFALLPLEEETASIKAALYLVPHEKPEFKSYDADNQILTSGLLGKDRVGFMIAPRDAKAMYAHWPSVQILARYFDAGTQPNVLALLCGDRLLTSVDTDSVYRVGRGVTAPSVISKVDAGYSKEAARVNLQGTVLLSLIVNANGKPSDIHVIRSLGMGLDEKAMEAVSRWKFKPGMISGIPVKVAATAEVNFKFF